MLYALVRATVRFGLNLFYRIQVSGPPAPDEGPVMFVGNHPNALMDPALIFAVARRRVTFLAKEPLFRMPVIGVLIKALGALPVYRRQDDPSQMGKNEGTLEAASAALAQGGAITLFPEGKSHSEPQLASLKTGAARIALRAARLGASVRIVPVGLTYQAKNRFRSEVLVERGEAIPVPAPAAGDVDAPEAVQALTAAIADRLGRVTLNVEAWEDLPLLKTAEALYALRSGEPAEGADRLRRFAEGMRLLRSEQPERYAALKEEVAGFQRRLTLVRATPSDLAIVYQRGAVWLFTLRNLSVVLLGLPLFAAGAVLFAAPFYAVRWLARAFSEDLDEQATVKFLATCVVSPIWWLGLALAGYGLGGWGVCLVAAAGALPLAVFTRSFLEGRREAIRDVRVFFALGNRARLKARLLIEGERLGAAVQQLAAELAPRL